MRLDKRMYTTEQICERAASAQKVAVLTGAGMSRESGIPTFRGEDGLWKKHRPEELASPVAFRKDPILVWEWYDWRRSIVGKAEPHAGHIAIAEMEQFFEDFLLITQNVDGLHRRAGSRKLVEIHGCINRAKCTVCGNLFDLLPAPLDDLPVHCECGRLARPDVLWFGESYDQSLLGRALEFMSEADFVLVVGTSGMVSMPVYLCQEASRCGAFITDINPERNQLDQLADASIRGTAGETLVSLWTGIQKAKSSRE